MKRRCGFLFFILLSMIFGFGTFVSCSSNIEENQEDLKPFPDEWSVFLLCDISDSYDSGKNNFCLLQSFIDKDIYWGISVNGGGIYYGENFVHLYSDRDPIYSYSYDSSSGRYILYEEVVEDDDDDTQKVKFDSFELVSKGESWVCLKFEDEKYRWFINRENLYEFKINANGGTMDYKNLLDYAGVEYIGASGRSVSFMVPSGTYGYSKGVSGTFSIPTVAYLDLNRDGWNFVGWAKTADAVSAEIEDGGFVTASDNVELYAVWIKNVSYTITYSENGGTFASESGNTQLVEGETFDGSVSATLRTKEDLGLSREGYVFKGWAYSADAAYPDVLDGGNLDVSENCTLYAVWAYDVSYTVTFDPNGGSMELNQQTVSGQTVLGNVSGTLYTKYALRLSRGRDRFKGWSVSSSGNVVSYNDGASITLTADTTLYAVWDRFVSHDVSFDANGGSISTEWQTIEGTEEQGVSGTLKKASDLGCTRSGYKFKGWATSNSASSVAYTDGKSISLSGNITLYAVWDKIVTYTITYDPNGGSMTSNASTTQTATGTESEGASVTLRPASCSGYVFAGWAKSSSATTATYTSTTLPVTIYSDMTLYAVWALPTYTVTYKQTTVFNSSSAKRTVQKGSYTLLDPSYLGLSRNGYTFLGWSTSTSSSSYYPAGSSIEITRDTTLYGIWQQSPNPYCYIRLYKPSYSTNSQSMMYGPVSANVGGYSISPNNGYSSSAYTSSYYKVSAIGQLSYTTLCKRRQTSLSTGGYTYTDITRSGTYTFEYGGYYTIDCTTGGVTKN